MPTAVRATPSEKELERKFKKASGSRLASCHYCSLFRAQASHHPQL